MNLIAEARKLTVIWVHQLEIFALLWNVWKLKSIFSRALLNFVHIDVEIGHEVCNFTVDIPHLHLLGSFPPMLCLALVYCKLTRS